MKVRKHENSHEKGTDLLNGEEVVLCVVLFNVDSSVLTCIAMIAVAADVQI